MSLTMARRQVSKHREVMVSPAFRRYLVIGGSVYLFELLVIVLVQWLGARPTVAVSVSFWFGVMVSFGLQKIITFGDRRLHYRVLVSQLIAVALLLFFNWGFTVMVTSLLAPPLPAVATRTLALAITTLWNFYLYRTRIFKTEGVGYTEI